MTRPQYIERFIEALEFQFRRHEPGPSGEEIIRSMRERVHMIDLRECIELMWLAREARVLGERIDSVIKPIVGIVQDQMMTHHRKRLIEIARSLSDHTTRIEHLEAMLKSRMLAEIICREVEQ